MPDPLIAIVGSVDPNRQQELHLNDPDRARQAAEELGAELAKRGCRIQVYSSTPTFLEAHVVRGYVASKAAKPESILVCHPINTRLAPFPEETQQPELFTHQPAGRKEWEIAFYLSLFEADGMVLMGGGHSSFVAGIVAVGSRTALLPLAAFGGAAYEIYELLQTRQSCATPQELGLMAQQGGPQWAEKCVAALLNQLQRRAEGEQDRLAVAYRKTLTRYAVAASLLFLVSLATIPLTWASGGLGKAFYYLLFIAPAVAGASGAIVRVLFDFWRRAATSYAPQLAGITAALGLVAGGVAGALFIAAELVSFGAMEAQQASRLLLFAVPVGFIAGSTLDKVFPKLFQKDVVRTELIETNKQPPEPGPRP